VIFTHTHTRTHCGGVAGRACDDMLASGMCRIIAPNLSVSMRSEIDQSGGPRPAINVARAQYQFGRSWRRFRAPQVDGRTWQIDGRARWVRCCVRPILINECACGEKRAIDGLEFEFQWAPTAKRRECSSSSACYKLLNLAETASQFSTICFRSVGADVRDASPVEMSGRGRCRYGACKADGDGAVSTLPFWGIDRMIR